MKDYEDLDRTDLTIPFTPSVDNLQYDMIMKLSEQGIINI